MTRETVRTNIITAAQGLQASWAAYPLTVEYDNLLIDMAAQLKPFVRLSIHYMDGYQVDFSKTPTHRYVGTILVEAYTKEGQGSSIANNLLDHFYKPLQMSDKLLPVRTHAAKFLPTQKAVAGWQINAVAVPFWVDDIIS